VLLQAARKLGAPLTEEGAVEIAARARGTPRVAGRLLRRVRDFAGAERAPQIDQACAARSLARLEVDEAGLDSLDRRYLRALIEHYGGGPAGVETIAYAIAEARDAVEDVIEPYLMQQGFIQRTPRGRVACARAYLHYRPHAAADPARTGRAVRRRVKQARSCYCGALAASVALSVLFCSSCLALFGHVLRVVGVLVGFIPSLVGVGAGGGRGSVGRLGGGGLGPLSRMMGPLGGVTGVFGRVLGVGRALVGGLVQLVIGDRRGRRGFRQGSAGANAKLEANRDRAMILVDMTNSPIPPGLKRLRRLLLFKRPARRVVPTRPHESVDDCGNNITLPLALIAEPLN